MRNIKMIRKCEDMSNVNMSHPVLTAGRSKIYPMTYSGSQSVCTRSGDVVLNNDIPFI